MIFPSYEFLLVFLPVVLCFWLSKLPLSLRLAMLTVASYIFYGWHDWRFTGLIAASTLVDYWCGREIGATGEHARRRFFLLASVVTNLAFLGFFKYYDFFAESLHASLSALGVDASLHTLGIVLPIGISFYTFQSMSYTIDIYRSRARPAPDFLHFAAYVSLFPQLVAGPIVRYEAMADQLHELEGRRVSSVEFSHGVWFFVLGLAKKMLIADNVAPLADRLFDGTGVVETGFAWLGSLAYTVQLYFDFSGYSDMAVGLGLMLGFRFPVNFDSPYKSVNISDFWNRWHITLSHFLRDYLFIPLGGSRGTLALTVRNLLITMFLGGLWHGAQWTYVVWGLFHGALLTGHAAFRTLAVTLPRLLAIPLTFFAVHLGWVLFRAPTFERAGEIYRGLFGKSGTEDLFARTLESQTFGNLPAFVDVAGGPELFPFLVLGLLIAFFAPNTHEIRRSLHPAWAVVLALLTMTCVILLGKETPFIYFQF